MARTLLAPADPCSRTLASAKLWMLRAVPVARVETPVEYSSADSSSPSKVSPPVAPVFRFRITDWMKAFG